MGPDLSLPGYLLECFIYANSRNRPNLIKVLIIMYYKTLEVVYRIVEGAEWPVLTTGLRVGSRNPGGGNHGQCHRCDQKTELALTIVYPCISTGGPNMRERFVQLGSHTQLLAGAGHGTLIQSHWDVSSTKSGCHYQKRKMAAGRAKTAGVPSKESAL